MDKDSRIRQILAHLGSAASTAADGVNEAVHSAGEMVGDKYAAFKLGVEINRLQDEQCKLFCDIGRTMYMIHTGAIPSEPENAEGETMDAQQTVDQLLAKADEKQKALDEATEKLNKLNGQKVCAVCGAVANPKDKFCANCGAKFPDTPPES
ncbi:MAG: hypothetical protein AB7V55_08420 [Oscillospiraceae bacterium]